jgi:hypothetical protein
MAMVLVVVVGFPGVSGPSSHAVPSIRRDIIRTATSNRARRITHHPTRP